MAGRMFDSDVIEQVVEALEGKAERVVPEVETARVSYYDGSYRRQHFRITVTETDEYGNDLR